MQTCQAPRGLAAGVRLCTGKGRSTTKTSRRSGHAPCPASPPATLEVYRRGAEPAATRGILIADTKIELGRAPDGTLVLADEVLTSDSSRYWPADSYEPGRVQFSFDKQYVRDWSLSTGWDKAGPPPEVPDEVVEVTRARYVEVYERRTGNRWT